MTKDGSSEIGPAQISALEINLAQINSFRSSQVRFLESYTAQISTTQVQPYLGVLLSPLVPCDGTSFEEINELLISHSTVLFTLLNVHLLQVYPVEAWVT